MSQSLLVYASCFTSFFAANLFAEPSFRGVGTLPDGIVPESQCFAISGDGNTVVGLSYGATGSDGFRWTETDGIVGLGVPAGLARAVSGDGSVIVGRGEFGAFRWQSGVVTTLEPGASYSQALSVSADGQIVVGSRRGDPNYQDIAHLWMASGTSLSLGTLPAYVRSLGLGISADGSTVVGYSEHCSPCVREAFRWTEADGMQSLVGPSKFDTVAHAANVDGTVIVGSAYNGTIEQAFRWTASDGMQLLGTLVGPSVGTMASMVSADGSVIVGTAYLGPGGKGYEPSAFIWDIEHGMRDLQEVVANEFGPELCFWTLGNAYGVSADGLRIVGQRYSDCSPVPAEGTVIDLTPSVQASYGDIYPCGGNGIIDVDDIIAMLDAFAGSPACAAPKP